METGNPYHTDWHAPFAGRQAELARLNNYLNDPNAHNALVFLGRRWMGKTAILRRFDQVFDETYVSIYLRLPELESEQRLLPAAVRYTEQALAHRDITVARLPAANPVPEDWITWFDEIWLPGVFHVIRPHRKLVLLLDDVQPSHDLSFLSRLLLHHPQFKVVLTFAANQEDHLPETIKPTQILRLTHLNREEVTWLLREPVAGHYAVEDAACDFIYRATGGHPLFAQRFGRAIYEHVMAQHNMFTVTPDLAKVTRARVYRDSSGELESFWQESTENERQLLLALSQLHYADPLNRPTLSRLSSYLIDSDHPLDQTAISAALRRLEYRELVAHQAEGIVLTCDLLRIWLLEHAQHMTSATPSGGQRRRPLWIVAAVVLVIALLALLINLSNAPTTRENPIISPTVTLDTGG
jgi:hypothetical protein